MRCYIVDNEDFSIDYLAELINQTPGLELVGTETNPLEALRKITAEEVQVDICFLDIEMPKLSGIDLATLIQPYAHTIFTTAFEHYAFKALDTEFIAYLLKPIEYPLLLKAIQKVQHINDDTLNNRSNRSNIIIQSQEKGKLIRIKIEDIFYVEAQVNYVSIVLADIQHITYLTLKEMESILPNSFVKTHRSFLININKLDSVAGGMIHLTNRSVVPLSATYKQDFSNRIDNYVVRSKRKT